MLFKCEKLINPNAKCRCCAAHTLYCVGNKNIFVNLLSWYAFNSTVDPNQTIRPTKKGNIKSSTLLRNRAGTQQDCRSQRDLSNIFQRGRVSKLSYLYNLLCQKDWFRIREYHESESGPKGSGSDRNRKKRNTSCVSLPRLCWGLGPAYCTWSIYNKLQWFLNLRYWSMGGET